MPLASICSWCGTGEKGPLAVSPDQTAADQLQEKLARVRSLRGASTASSPVSCEVLEAARIFGPLGLGFQKGLGAEGPRRTKELLALLGDGGVFDPEGRIQIAEVELTDPGEGPDRIVHAPFAYQALVGAKASQLDSGGI